MTVFSDASIDPETRTILEHGAFDASTFSDLRARVMTGTAGEDANRIRGTVEPPADGDIVALPAPGSDDRRALEALGLEAISRGEVGVVVLAGGMATRFGGVVKAAADVLPGRSFFDCKVGDARAVAARTNGRVPMYLMTSFATHEVVASLARAATTDAVPIEVFPQSVSIRMTPDGGLFREGDRPSLYAPGHGDLPSALRRSGVLARFRAAGGKHLLMSNVDNVGATLSPAIVGQHLHGGRPITCEVARKEPGEKGGAPARVGLGSAAAQIVEAFRFPKSFDQDRIAVFNTNTFVFDATALDRDFPLTWFAVNKSVDGRPAVQMERLVGELTAFLPTQFVAVERYGAESRFLPVKDPEELARRLDDIRAVLART